MPPKNWLWVSQFSSLSYDGKLHVVADYTWVQYSLSSWLPCRPKNGKKTVIIQPDVGGFGTSLWGLRPWGLHHRPYVTGYPSGLTMNGLRLRKRRRQWHIFTFDMQLWKLELWYIECVTLHIPALISMQRLKSLQLQTSREGRSSRYIIKMLNFWVTYVYLLYFVINIFTF